MTEAKGPTLGHDDARARDAVRSLPRPQADPGYRKRLREAFVAGRIAPSAGPAARGRRGPPAQWLVAPIAAAALLLAVSVLNRGPGWQVTAVTGDGIAVVDGRPVPLGHVEDLARRIHPGAVLELPAGGGIEISAPGLIAIELTPGTAGRLPTPPGRWFGRAVAAEFRRGQVRITTGPAFAGARLTLRTPEAAVEVAGTTLAVICEPAGTCVCVLEGRVRVGRAGGGLAPVDAGRRRYVFRDGRAADEDVMRPVEAVELVRLRERHGWWAPAPVGSVRERPRARRRGRATSGIVAARLRWSAEPTAQRSHRAFPDRT